MSYVGVAIKGAMLSNAKVKMIDERDICSAQSFRFALSYGATGPASRVYTTSRRCRDGVVANLHFRFEIFALQFSLCNLRVRILVQK